MATTKYGKYIITDPAPRVASNPQPYHAVLTDAISVASQFRPGEGRYLSKDTIASCPFYLAIGRMMGEPEPQPFIDKHKHEVDEIIMFVSVTEDGTLGADVEVWMGEEGEKHIFNKTAVVYVPKGLTHTPIYFRNFQEGRWFYLISILNQTIYG